MYNLLKSCSDAWKVEIKDFTKLLISTPSISRKEKIISELIYKKMKALDFDMVYKDKIGNIIGLMLGMDAGPTLLLNSHMDTIAPDKSKWNNSPYEVSISNNRLYGVGASDCKGGIVSQIYAASILKRCLLPLKGNLIVAATVTEENGMSIGVRELIKETIPSLDLKVDYVILGEPTDLSIYYGHDGRVEFDIKLENQNLERVKKGTEKICSYLDMNYNTARNNSLNLQTGTPSTIISLGKLYQSKIHVQKKVHQGESPMELFNYAKDSIKQLLKNEGISSMEMHIAESKENLSCGKSFITKKITKSWETDPVSPFIQKSISALKSAGCNPKVDKWKLDNAGTGTAGSTYSNEFGLPVIGYGPGEENEAHAPNESVDISKIMECTYGTASIIHGLIGIPVFGWTSDEI